MYVEPPGEIPKSFYPGMWLREAGHDPWSEPTAEVLRVGRKNVLLQVAGSATPWKAPIVGVQSAYRLVYASERPKLWADWIKPGAEFSLYQWGKLKIRQVRWRYASVEFENGVLIFPSLLILVRNGHPRRDLWDRLRED